MSSEAHPPLGKWRITSMALGDTEFSDLLGPGYIRFDADGGGEFAFGAVQGGLDCHFGSDSIHFSCEGNDEMDPACGDGDAELDEDGTLAGEIRSHRGDESSFTARRW